MLFLFVLMLVGVDASDSVVETIRGQRLFAILGGLILGVTLVVGVGQISLGTAVGLDEANEDGNIQALANILFSQLRLRLRGHLALLITAAVGAMVLAHRERLTPKPTQAAAGRPAGPRRTPRPGSTSARCRPRASSPGTTRSTPRRCCPTAPPPRPRSPGCWPPAARSAPAPRDVEAVQRSIDFAPRRRPTTRDQPPRTSREGATEVSDGQRDAVHRALRDPVHHRLRSGCSPGATRSWCSCASS